MKKTTLVLIMAVALVTMAAELKDCGASQIDRELGETRFSDVNGSHPFYAGMRVAEHYEWMLGYPDGTLRPDEQVSAKQLASMVERIYSDGMTRAEAATYLAEGSIALQQHSVAVETIETANNILIINRSTLPIDMSGWVLDWGNYEYEYGEMETEHTFADGFILRPKGQTNYSPPDGLPVGSSNTLENEFGVSIDTG